MTTPLAHYLMVSAALFCVGLGAVLVRRNAIMVLVGIELMLNAANLNFIVFWRYRADPDVLTGLMFVLFAIAVAAAEAAVGLALIVAVYRHFRSTHLDQFNHLKG
jgi:NADH:ubiquinone oxidoreductase subunit K